MCQENITGIFARCILAPKRCRGAQKKYKVNIKEKERKEKYGFYASMHSCTLITSYHSFLSSKHILKSPKRKIRAHRASFHLGSLYFFFKKAFTLCLSTLKLIFRFCFRCRPSPWDWSNLFQKEIIFVKSICFWIGALYVVMVIESFGCRPSPRDWSNLSQKV